MSCLLFFLQILHCYAIFQIANSLVSNCFLSYLCQIFFIANRFDTTRVQGTVPLRESFAIPFFYYQLSLIVAYFDVKKSDFNTKITLATFLFSISWQFNQFVLFLQSLAIYACLLLQILPIYKADKVFYAFSLSLTACYVLQFFNPMIPRSIIASFIPSYFYLKGFLPTGKLSCLQKIVSILKHILLMAISTAFLNYVLKYTFPSDTDSHIFKFLMAKIQKPEKTFDFDASLYVCNGSFGFMDRHVFERLFGILSILFIFGLGCLTSKVIKKLLKNDHENFKDLQPAETFTFFITIAFGLLALLIVRLKYLFTPFIAISAVLTLSKLVSNRKLLTLIAFLLISKTVFDNYQKWGEEFSTEQEFYDPDTVEMLEFIQKSTKQSSVFSGTMQVMSMVKLSTDRAVTNHPHYEDKKLRDKTFDVYQIYAKIEDIELRDKLKKYGTTHIIVENSVCFQKGNDSPDSSVEQSSHCTTKGILDRVNTNLGFIRPRRFCSEIVSSSKYFKKVFENRTFRIYKMQ